MNIFSILAHPASHSLSPALHNSVFTQNKANAIYTRQDISPENLEEFMKHWKTDTLQKGLSVSIPHKENIQKYCDVLDESAQYIGAVNTVYKKNGKIYGTNTDWIGFKESLEKQYSGKKKRYIVLGAGGASRAIIYALLALESPQIYIWNRTQNAAENLVKEFSKISDRVFIATTEDLGKISLETDCIINTTSVGMQGKLEDISPFPKSFFHSFHSAFDIVYTPKNTIFLQDCRNAGGKSMSGENMLVLQAVEQSKLFLDSLSQPIPKNIEQTMQNALLKTERSFANWTPPVLSTTEKEDILHTIVQYKKEDIFLSKEFSQNNDKSYKTNENNKNTQFDFYKALSQKKNSPHVIAEIKPASPSQGKIFIPKDSVEKLAKLYEQNGVSAISVLTDFPFFAATIENLKKAKQSVSIPLLRKDFIIDSSQIVQAKKYGASAVLLMRSVLSSKQIEEFLLYARTLELDCLVEVHDEKELRDVLENTSANIIGVNSRDLKTMKINPENFETLMLIAKTYPNFSEKIWIAESGISSFKDIKSHAKSSNAVLIGTGILQSENREEKIKELTQV